MSGRECVIEGIKKQELRSKNGAQGTRDIEGKAAREAASELGSERVSMERTGMRDIEGSELSTASLRLALVTRVGASKAGGERVSTERMGRAT